ncbi:HAD family hydrolase [Petropleomorpha daqingensis]|uniref:Putative hydrolase of the HAD superfamily n=1 Tax=Petropleomorpha daqingensis TaxID=2026353 RepID=A0A853C9L5_9ACTN|nr:HAD family hydrolase [Petropleomorpha daqingensis]NYJ04625.1 putative hydrolase of the HAD superfamily [Petropleomorpha daqingensis]
MTTPRLPSLVIFDLDDTLYPYEPCHKAGMAALVHFATRELGVKERAFLDVWDAARKKVKARLGATGSSHSRLLYGHEAIEMLGLRSQPGLALALEQEYWREYLLAAKLRPGARDLLSSLRYNNIPIAIVTDLTAQIQFRKLVHLELDQVVDHVVVSEEATTDKIGLEPFRVLFDRLPRQDGNHVWFVGDSVADVSCIERLVKEELIESGTGWLLAGHGEPPADSVTWSRMEAIENALAELVPGGKEASA